MNKKAEKKEARGMTIQCKEGGREDGHKLPEVNNDIDITNSIWSLILNSSFLLVCITYTHTNDCTSLYYFPLKDIFDYIRIFLI